MTKKTPKQFSPHIYPEWGELFKNLDDIQKADILMAITMYPNYEPKDNPVWGFIKSQIDREYELFNERCQKNGEISRDYWKRIKSNDTERIPNDTERHPKLELELEHKQEKKEIYKESFEQFWEEYPKQRAGSKQKAYQAYCKAIKEKRATEVQILQSVRNYKICDEVKRGFAKGCAAWINDDRFNNEYVPEKEQSEMTEEELLAWGRG